MLSLGLVSCWRLRSHKSSAPIGVAAMGRVTLMGFDTWAKLIMFISDFTLATVLASGISSVHLQVLIDDIVNCHVLVLQ